MAQPTPDPGARLDQELLRFTFCGIVIASFFAALGASPDLRRFLTPGGTDITTTLLGLSAGLAFAYLLGVASALKYQAPRQVDRFPLSSKVTRYFYDASINIFGVYLLLVLVGWVDAHWLHLPNQPWVWPVYLVLFSAGYFIARVVWALAQRLIEWHYDLIEEQSKR